MKRVLALLALLLAIAGFLCWGLWLQPRARLVIANESGLTISTLEVRVWHQEFSLGTLAPGEEKEVTLRDYSDSAWLIRGRWPDGSPIQEQAGYLTQGMSVNDRAIFHRDRRMEFISQVR